MKKTIVGTSLKLVNKAKMNGKLNLKDLAIINIINKLKNNSELTLSTSIINKLDKITRDISNKNPDICSYRKDNAFTKINENFFITNSVNVNNLYTLWLNRGNVGSLNDFLDAILQDQTLLIDENKW